MRLTLELLLAGLCLLAVLAFAASDSDPTDHKHVDHNDSDADEDSEEQPVVHKPTKPNKHRDGGKKRNGGGAKGEHGEPRRKHPDEERRNRKMKKNRGQDGENRRNKAAANGADESVAVDKPQHKEHQHKQCSSNSDCMPGSCCVTKKRGQLRICRPFNFPAGKKCLDTCACSDGMECYAETPMKANGKRQKQPKKPTKKVKGVCKVPTADDITGGTYLKHGGGAVAVANGGMGPKN